VAAFLRLFRLGHQSLWVDEAATWAMAGIGQPLSWSHVLENIHGPFYGVLLHGWAQLFGDSEWALRLPSALFGVATVPLMGLVAARWLGAPVAVPAMWLAAASPFLVWYGQEVRNYSLVVLCACASALLLLRASRALTPGGVLGYLAVAATGLLANFSFAFLAPLHLVWWLGPKGRRLRRLGIGAAIVLALGLAVLPWLPQVRGQWAPERLLGGGEGAPSLRGATTFHPAALPFALHSFAVGYTLGPPLRELRQGAPGETVRRHLPEAIAVAVVFGALGLLGLRAVHRRRRLWQSLLLLTYAALANVKVFNPRYAAVSVPGFLLILAAGLADLGPRLRAAFVLAIAAVWALSLQHHYFVPRYGKEDMRSAIALIGAQARTGERVVAANTETLLSYYYRGPLPVVPFWIGYASNPERLAAKADAALAGGGAWVVLSRPEDLDPSGAFARYLDARYPEAERFRFEGVRIWHLAPSNEAPGSVRSRSPGT
jgi:4-amino-4-deoxy-L-arabinose transferase-like glycosyltransferase